MKKKILLVILCIVCLLGFTGCGSEQTNTYKIGETVETDKLKLTLNNSKLSFALNSKYSSDYGTPIEYDSSNLATKYYVANKGHTLVYFEFTVENLDRGSVSLGGVDNVKFITVKYNNKNYKPSDSTDTAKFILENDSKYWRKYSVSNILLFSGESKTYRGYLNIPVEANDLEDTFEITFTLPSSKGSKKFTYKVTKEDRDNIKETIKTPLLDGLDKYE